MQSVVCCFSPKYDLRHQVVNGCRRPPLAGKWCHNGSWKPSSDVILPKARKLQQQKNCDLPSVKRDTPEATNPGVARHDVGAAADGLEGAAHVALYSLHVGERPAGRRGRRYVFTFGVSKRKAQGQASTCANTGWSALRVQCWIYSGIATSLTHCRTDPPPHWTRLICHREFIIQNSSDKMEGSRLRRQMGGWWLGEFFIFPPARTARN